MPETDAGTIAEKAPNTDAQEPGRWRYGLDAVLIGVLGVIGALGVAAIAVVLIKDKDSMAAATAFAAPAITAISTIAAAYFGIKVGQENTADAAKATATANQTALDVKDQEGHAKAMAAAMEATAKATANQTLVPGDIDSVIDGLRALR